VVTQTCAPASSQIERPGRKAGAFVIPAFRGERLAAVPRPNGPTHAWPTHAWRQVSVK